MRQKIHQGHTWLIQSVDVTTLALFRFFFGAIMVWEVLRYFYYNRVARYYIEPQFYFPYEPFTFLTPLPGQGMIYLFIALGICGGLIAVGLFYRWASILFFVGYTYTFLLDKTQYNNHYYFICLLSFLLIFIEANRKFSLDAWWRPTWRRDYVPRWQLVLLQAQVFIVYFYGGLAKLNGDWLAGEPLRIWFSRRTDYPLIGPFLGTEAGVYFFSYSGLFFDLSVGFLLLWPRTRWLAIVGVLSFNLMNVWLFSIGIFPYLMIAATILFISPDTLQQVWHRLNPASTATKTTTPPLSHIIVGGSNYSTLTLILLGIYVLFQLLFPLRHFLYPGNPNWTEEGHRFAWRMKLRTKQAGIKMMVSNPQTYETWEVDFYEDLNERQLNEMAKHPDMVWQYAQFLKEKWQAKGLDAPIIRAQAWASLNGRPTRYQIDTIVNLAEVDYPLFGAAPWITPLEDALSPRQLLATQGIRPFISFSLGLLILGAIVITLWQGGKGARSQSHKVTRPQNGKVTK